LHWFHASHKTLLLLLHWFHASHKTLLLLLLPLLLLPAENCVVVAQGEMGHCSMRLMNAAAAAACRELRGGRPGRDGPRWRVQGAGAGLPRL
jgi:hypothetical protein